EDVIRDFHVTGVQTCALPILKPSAASLYISVASATASSARIRIWNFADSRASAAKSFMGVGCSTRSIPAACSSAMPRAAVDSSRSEERRVGEEYQYQWEDGNE